jgi:hypothetical protein
VNLCDGWLTRRLYDGLGYDRQNGIQMIGRSRESLGEGSVPQCKRTGVRWFLAAFGQVRSRERRSHAVAQEEYGVC